MQPISLLLVDDEKDYIDTLSQRLRHRGLTAQCAYSGAAALRLLEEGTSIDVVFLDIGMPAPDGLETLGILKRKYPLIEVIMLTGHATVHTAVDAIKQGAFDYLTKPASADDLIAKATLAATRKNDRENKILDIRMQPYLTDTERKEQIRQVLES